MTLKEISFVKRYLETMNATQAAMDVYKCRSRNVAGVVGYRVLRKVKISRVIENILDKAGCTNEAIAKRLKDMIGGLDSIGAIKMVLKLRGCSNI